MNKQIGILDQTIFPPGMEALDSGFGTFLATILFHHKYRNPFFTTLSYMYDAKKAAAEATQEPWWKPGGGGPPTEDPANELPEKLNSRSSKKSWRTR